LVPLVPLVCCDEVSAGAGGRLAPKALRLKSGVAVIPKQSEVLNGCVGHDVAAADGNGRVLVVADGVGGWVQHGVNPRQAAKMCVSGVLEGARDTSVGLHPLLAKVLAENDFAGKGTRTVTTVRLRPDAPQLECLTVGDGVLHVYRRVSHDGHHGPDGQWRLLTSVEDPESRRAYNRPQQVGDRVKGFVPALGCVEVEVGDLVMLASDGFGDNLGTSDVLAALNAPAAQHASSASQMAQYLAGLAFLRSISCIPGSPTPFHLHRE
jgi:serine/threonine protein phosphatase PrpC